MEILSAAAATRELRKVKRGDVYYSSMYGKPGIQHKCHVVRAFKDGDLKIVVIKVWFKCNKAWHYIAEKYFDIDFQYRKYYKGRK